MLRPRLPVFLMLHKGAVYKSVGFQNYKYIGDPVNTVRIFNEFEVDEFIVVDVDATRRQVQPDFNLAAVLNSISRAPLCFGGGIRTFEDAQNLFAAGVEKVVISSAAFDDSRTLTMISEAYGSQSLVVCLDVSHRPQTSRPTLRLQNGRIALEGDVFRVLDRLMEAGVGEILVNDIDRDGMNCGFNEAFVSKIVNYCDVPITAVGGASSLEDFVKLYKGCGSQRNMGMAAGSLWVYHGVNQAVLLNYPKRSTLQKLFD